MDEYDVQIRERITALESSYAMMQKRLNDIEELVSSVHKMTAEMQFMRKDINRMSEEVSELQSKPAKSWETLVYAVIGALAGGICTMLISAVSGG